MKPRQVTSRPAVMGDVFFLVLRRMRFPLLLVVFTYALCTAVLAVIPSTNPDGTQGAPLTVFEAFYVVSYTATTIGFGEVPRPYNAAQRMWMTFTIYVSVAAWTYSLFAIIGLLQDRAFQSTVRVARFSQTVHHMREPFYIVCGLGDTGRTVCHGLDHLGLRFVAIERDPDRVQKMRQNQFSVDPPIATGDASATWLLQLAGLMNPYCRGVVALTDDDAVNQGIAVTVRLLKPRVPVLARIRNQGAETHIGVFGGDVVVNPFAQFADYLAAAVTAPQRYKLRRLLTGLPGEPAAETITPPRGHWIVAGYGRFGRAVTESLRATGMDISVVDSLHYDEGGVDVRGTGTRSEDLRAAGIERAVGLVTANSSDTKNLAVAVTARALNHDLYIVNRQNALSNGPLFEAFNQEMLMVPSRIVAEEFLARITTPLLNKFLRLIPQHNEAECEYIHNRLATLDPGRNPEVWDLAVGSKMTPALAEYLNAGGRYTVAHLVADPDDRSRRIPIMVLLVRRGNKNIQLPGSDFPIQAGDKLLLAGTADSKHHLEQVLRNQNMLTYVLTGQQTNGGAVWRWLTRRHPAPVVPLADVASCTTLTDVSTDTTVQQSATQDWENERD